VLQVHSKTLQHFNVSTLQHNCSTSSSEGVEQLKRVILVLGMYRSGTSAVTKGLETMGVRLSDPSEICFHNFNVKGDWEDAKFCQFNWKLIKTLDALQNRRRNILPLTEKEVDFLYEKGLFRIASELVLERVAAPTPFAIKDCKFVPLLPFWKRIFEACKVQVSFVIALRNPLSVVASFAAAEEIFGKQEEEKSFWLWISYMLNSLEYTEGYERLLVDYDELLKDPAHQLERMARAFQLTIDGASLQSYRDDFLETSLRHFQGKENEEGKNNFCRTFSLEMYEKLFQVANGDISFHQLKNSFEKWKELFFAAYSLLSWMEKKEYEVVQLHQTIREREQVIVSLRQTVTQQAHSLGECNKTIHERNLQMMSLMKKDIF